MRRVVSYSEAFKRQVVEEIARGKFLSFDQAQRAYGIRGSETVGRWVRTYGPEDLLPQRIRIETMKERDELKEARQRIRELNSALADAHMEQCLEHAFFEIACERLQVRPEDFKKKNAVTLSDALKKRGMRGA